VFRYAEEAALDRRDNPREDIITDLLTAEPDGQPLTDLEFKNFFTLMMVAGNETTRHTISHGLIYLANHPDQFNEWHADPSAMSEVATEEILRTSAVTMHFRRTAVEDTEIRGVPVKAGDRVVLWYTSANYDDDVFDDPFTLDLKRSPNNHVTFGTGRHVCLGAALARLEVRVVFEELLSRIDSLEILAEPDRLRSNFISGIKHLPVRFGAA
jgi:cholest-4-en-3-one 26-monooxygenase